MKNKTALITGSAGLIGSEAVKFFIRKNFRVVGIDNNMRQYFFGPQASTAWNKKNLEETYPDNYKHYQVDIRDNESIGKIFRENQFDLIIHTAAQPSHDWAAKEPLTDFGINAQGTLILLENMRKFSPKAVFIFTSTNKVYGDLPNSLPLVEMDSRYELPVQHPYYRGIDEMMSIDKSKHSIFGVSKVAADVLVQEYGRYFGFRTGVFRGGCLTGPAHSGTKLHGFLAYLARCIATGTPYTIYGYKGKQVRDNIHSFDLVNAFYHFYLNPHSGEVYNMGGSRHSNISVLEAIKKIEDILEKKGRITYKDDNRSGDHIWYISDVSKFQSHYPEWKYQYNIDDIIEEICYGGHFSEKSEGSSTLTVYNLPDRSKLPRVCLMSHTTGAYGPVQALRHYLASRSEKMFSIEHSLVKSDTNKMAVLSDLKLNLKWYYQYVKNADYIFAVNAVNAISASILKLLGYRGKVIYYAVDYSSRRYSSYLLNRLFHLADLIAAKTADYVWNSTPQALSIRSAQGIPDEKNVLVRTGVNKQPEKLQLADNPNKIIIDGYLSKEKLVKKAVLAVIKYAKDNPDVRLSVIPGEINRDELSNFIRKHKAAKFVTIFDDHSHQKAVKRYHEHGIGLGLYEITDSDPAEFRDPMEIKQFISSGLAVIASPGFQVAQEINDSKIGVVSNNEVDDIVEAIRYLHKNNLISFRRQTPGYIKDHYWHNIFDKALFTKGQ